jgi:chromosome segregation ATPase
MGLLVQVPEELLHDGDAQELQSAIEAMQAEFIAVHKELEAMRETSAQPATLQRRLAQLEEERDQLGSKIQSTKAKVKTSRQQGGCWQGRVGECRE